MENFIIHTGSIVKEYLDARSISQRDLARSTGVTEKHISNVLNGKARLTEEMALKLEKVMPEIPAGYWINYEAKYREYIARQAEETEIGSLDLKAIAKRFHFKEVFKGSDLNPTEMALEMLKLLNISSFDCARDAFKHLSVAYMEDGGDAEAQIVWLQLCRREIDAQNPPLDDTPFDLQALKKNLEVLRYISLDKDRDMAIEGIREFLNEHGVYLAIRDQITNCKVRGALVAHYHHPAVLLSNRFHRHDFFWFALAHEIGHLMLHYDGNDHVDLGEDDDYVVNAESADDPETEANRYARGFFIDRPIYERFRDSITGNEPTSREIREFAAQNLVDPGIVRGFLQHDAIIKHNQLTELTTKW